MTNTIVTRTETPAAPLFLTWAGESAPRLVRVPLIECPQCHEFCGHLYRDQDTPEGACLGCRIGWDLAAEPAIAAADAFWGAAEMSCSVCGVD